MYSLYKITNLLNNKNYIGVTNRNPEERFAEHKKQSSKSFIGKAIQSDGIENFSFEVLLTNIEDNRISSLECEYIKNIILFYLMVIMLIWVVLNIINILII